MYTTHQQFHGLSLASRSLRAAFRSSFQASFRAALRAAFRTAWALVLGSFCVSRSTPLTRFVFPIRAAWTLTVVLLPFVSAPRFTPLARLVFSFWTALVSKCLGLHHWQNKTLHKHVLKQVEDKKTKTSSKLTSNTNRNIATLPPM